ncbi:protein-disulfide reductase DsbD family protein [Frateuria aurantia]
MQQLRKTVFKWCGELAGRSICALALFLAGGRVQAQSVADLLPVTQAYQLSADTSTPGMVRLHWKIAPGYYLYRGQMRFTTSPEVRLGDIHLADGKRSMDPYLGPVETYHDSTDATVSYTLAAGDDAAELTVRYQGCHEVDPKLCYPPHSERIKLPPGPRVAQAVAGPSDSDAISSGPVPKSSGGSGSVTGIGFWLALLLAVAGGTVLNLMPCVLPVVLLKLGGLLESGADLQQGRRHATWYSLGVIASFTVLGLLVIGLRRAGSQVGWGMQLQQPWLLGVLACMMFGMGLAMTGWVQLGGRWGRVGDDLARRRGISGDFFTGVLAVVVASPCTAPMMGSALAYALVAPLLQAVAIFVGLGVGLALPYVILSWTPGLLRWLPRPGRWMDTLKQLLAFPMYLSVVWLVWVLARQRGADAVALALLAMTSVAFSVWLWSRSAGWQRWRSLLWLPLALCIGLPLLALARLTPAAGSGSPVVVEVAYDAGQLERLVSAGTPVFVDMTADWCITCKANEHVVLDAPAFRQLMRQSGAVYMKGDWTDVDPAISRFLQRYHSPGVPLYVVFGPNQREGLVLPTVLTQSVVAAAIRKVGGLEGAARSL